MSEVEEIEGALVPDAGLLLARKLVEVAKAIEPIGNDARNNYDKYEYTSAEAVLRVVRRELLKRDVRIGCLVSRVEHIPREGDKSDIVRVYTKHWFIDAETGFRSEGIPWFGDGTDRGDKASYKALTGGEKYFLRHQFQIPFGDDPEAEAGTPSKDRRLDAEEIKRVAKALASIDPKRQKLLLAGVGVDSTKELMVSHTKELYALLEAEKEKGARVDSDD